MTHKNIQAYLTTPQRMRKIHKALLTLSPTPPDGYLDSYQALLLHLILQMQGLRRAPSKRLFNKLLTDAIRNSPYMECY